MRKKYTLYEYGTTWIPIWWLLWIVPAGIFLGFSIVLSIINGGF
jgi:hypothetical protein